MKALLVLFLAMLKEWITSKKTLTALLTTVAGVVIKDPVLRDRVIGIGALLLAGQAVADHGATAAKVQAASNALTGSSGADCISTR